MLKTGLAIAFALFIITGNNSAGKKPFNYKKLIGADIGNPQLKGSVQILENGIQLTAGGADVWGTRDECYYTSIQKSGNFDFSARIESLTAPHLYTKAGIMVREDLTENCRHIFFQVFPDNKARNKNSVGFEFQYRAEKGGAMKAIYPPTIGVPPPFPVAWPNTWIRLTRTGNAFTGYCSTDGQTWKEYTSFTLELPAKIYLGVALTSHNIKATATAVFKDILVKK